MEAKELIDLVQSKIKYLQVSHSQLLIFEIVFDSLRKKKVFSLVISVLERAKCKNNQCASSFGKRLRF